MHHRKGEGRMRFLAGAGVGAGIMYFLDPIRGKRRRALVRDKLRSVSASSSADLEAVWRNLYNRSKGVSAELKHRLLQHEDAPNIVVEERIRSKLGRIVSRPHPIQVKADNGAVILSGPVEEREVGPLLACVRAVPGVRHVESRLEPFVDPDRPSAETRKEGEAPAFSNGAYEPWSPATRLVLGALGAWFTSTGRARRGIIGTLSSAVGVTLGARAMTNRPMKQLVEAGVGQRSIDIRKTLNINAPINEVFQFWTKFDNFPKFMSHLKEVRATGEGRSRWVACGPAGVTIEWNARITRLEPDRLLAWKSEPGSVLQNAGIVRFDSLPNGGTHVDIAMSYNPPAGAIGHAVASILGVDPKHAMDDDLVRLKSLLERGKATAKGHTVTLEELTATEIQ